MGIDMDFGGGDDVTRTTHQSLGKFVNCHETLRNRVLELMRDSWAVLRDIYLPLNRHGQMRPYLTEYYGNGMDCPMHSRAVVHSKLLSIQRKVTEGSNLELKRKGKTSPSFYSYTSPSICENRNIIQKF